MDTENLNITPENGGIDNKSEKTAKAKKIASKATQFAGAAGLGVAGTMAANAMNKTDEYTVETSESNEETTENATVEDSVEDPVEFDPNDIMIEDVEEVVLDEHNIEHPTEQASSNVDVVIVDEPQPITGEQIVEPSGEVAMIDVDDIIIETEDNTQADPMEIADAVYGGPDGWDQFDNPETLLADNDLESGEPDILGDILNA